MLQANKYLILIFITFSLVVLGVSYLIIHSRLFMENPEILSFGLTFDMTISIPILYYFLARKRKLPKVLLIPIFMLTLIAASLILPRHHRQFLDLIKHAIFPMEAFITTYLIFKITRVVKEYKRLKPKGGLGFPVILKECLVKTIGHGKVPEILGTEISILYYGLFAWKRPKRTGENAFTAYKKSGYGGIIGALVFLSLSEVLAFHVLFMQISSVAAWIIFALNLYGIIFILADFNASRREPTYIEDEKLYINAGIRWKAIVPVKDIKSVELSNESLIEKQILRATTILSGPNLVIVLEKTHRADGPYGIRKNFDKVLLNLDEPRRFRQLIIDTF
jgi:membrane protein YdbS with pleckstrin-like domain